MDLRIASSTATVPGAGQLRRAVPLTSPNSVQSDGFYTEFSNALKSVSATQIRSSKLQREVQLENPAVSLEETMVAMQKAQVAFQASLHVRNRMVQAYTDIMNMQV